MENDTIHVWREEEKVVMLGPVGWNVTTVGMKVNVRADELLIIPISPYATAAGAEYWYCVIWLVGDRATLWQELSVLYVSLET